jgi:peptidoglycan/xylan/chitin deacetylase (PgdA/CDA1 family)
MADNRRRLIWLARALIACLICAGPAVWALADEDVLVLTAEDYLPVYQKADTEEKVIAVTIDDMYQTENAEDLVNLAIRHGAKLTLFPVGENALRKEMKKLLRRAHENGFEIENHTYSHVGLYRLDDMEMAREVYLQSRAVDAALGVRYQQHFFRPYGGDGLDDQRTHLFARQMGMRGIAYWTVSGSDTPANQLIGTLAPGNVYLFHATDADTRKLKDFLPAAVKAGYKLVTMNELFGLPENETAEFQAAEAIPALAPYRPAPRLYRKGDFLWGVHGIQARLSALGYLDAPADGVYGEGTVDAVKNFQRDHGLPITGVCDMETQGLLSIGAQNEN